MTVPKAWRDRLTPLAVGALTLLAFLPALRNGFVDWDDQDHLLLNSDYRGLSFRHLRWMFTNLHLGNYQPLSWLTYGIDHAVWGMNPFGYHLTSVLLHAANAALFYWLGLRLLSLVRGEAGPDERLGAAASALLFSLHPLRVESVAWISERRDVLSAFFFLLALLSWLRGVRAGAPPDRRWALSAWACFVLSLLSKAMAVTFPAVLVLLDVYPLRRLPADVRRWPDRSVRALWLEKLPFLVPALAFAVLALVAQSRWGSTVTLAESSWADRLVESLFGLGFYLSKTLLPLRLSPLYEWRWLSDPQPLLAGAAFALACAAAVTSARARWPAGAAAYAYYVVTLLPVLGLVKLGHQTAADRYSYIPCLAWALLAGAGLAGLARARRQSRPAGRGFLPACLACAAALALMGSLTWRQIRAWESPVSLWSHALALDPASTIARPNLATALYEAGFPAEAAARLKEQLLRHPGDEDSRRMLSQIEAGTLEARPGLAKRHSDQGVDLSRRGELDTAIRHFRRALELDPGLASVRENLGLALYRQGRLEEAAHEFAESVRLEPGSCETRTDWGIALARLGRLDEAIAQFEAALRLKADYIDPRGRVLSSRVR